MPFRHHPPFLILPPSPFAAPLRCLSYHISGPLLYYTSWPDSLSSTYEMLLPSTMTVHFIIGRPGIDAYLPLVVAAATAQVKDDTLMMNKMKTMTTTTTTTPMMMMMMLM